MPAIKPSRKVFIGLVIGIAVLFCICVFTYFNRAASLHTLTAEVRSKQERLRDSEQMANRLSVVEQRYLEAQANLSFLEQGVSTKAYVPTLLRQLEELGRSTNLKVIGVRPIQPEVRPSAPEPSTGEGGTAQAKAKREPYDKLILDLDVHGKYWDAVRFLHEMTTLPKIVAVNNVQVSPIGQQNQLGSPVLSVRLNATAFILKDQPTSRGGSDTSRASAAVGRI